METLIRICETLDCGISDAIQLERDENILIQQVNKLNL